MARFARIVLVNEPYDVTHRGNRRSDVFFAPEDHEVYMECWLFVRSMRSNAPRGGGAFALMAALSPPCST